MKQKFKKVLVTLILLAVFGLMTSCGNDIILDNELPPKSTDVVPTTIQQTTNVEQTGNTVIGRPPIFVSSPLTRIGQNKKYAYAVVVDDPDFGNQLTLTASKLPIWLELTQQENQTTLISGTPKPEHIGGHPVELVVTDDTGLKSKQAFYVYVLDSQANNTKPLALTTSLRTQEDTDLSIVLKATDADSDELTYRITKMPENGTLTGTAPNLLYKPKLNSAGKDSLKFVVSDGNEESDETTVSIDVIPVNDAPTATSLSISTQRDKRVEVVLKAQDIDNTILSFSIVEAPKQGSLSVLYGDKVTYTPNQGFAGEDSFSFKVSDNQLFSNVAKVSLSIGVEQPEPEPENEKFRVLVTADVGWDPDDMQSIYRLIHYSDIFDIEGLVASVSADGFDPNPTLLRETIQDVQVDTLRAKGYSELTPEKTLLSRVSVGKQVKGAPKTGHDSEGSNQIIEQVKLGRERGDSRPLWILVWGPMTDIAQALHDDPSIASSIRIFSIGNVNSDMDLGSRDYVFNFMQTKVPGLFWIDNSSRVGFRRTYEGVFRGGNQSGEWSSQKFIDANIRGHGSAGDKFPLAYGNIGLKEGDSITLLYLIGPKFGGVGNVNDPTAPSWAGEYKHYKKDFPNYYIDCCDSETAAKESISKWRVQFLSHWKARWDRYN